MVFRERETEMPSWTSIIFTDTACSSSHSILVFFFFPFSLKITILSFVSHQIENSEFCDREALKDVEGTESDAVPSAADPCVTAED